MQKPNKVKKNWISYCPTSNHGNRDWTKTNYMNQILVREIPLNGCCHNPGKHVSSSSISHMNPAYALRISLQTVNLNQTMSLLRPLLQTIFLRFIAAFKYNIGINTNGNQYSSLIC